MRVIGIDKNGHHSSDNELKEGDFFFVDIGLTSDNNLAWWIINRGITLPLVVESIDEEGQTVKPKGGKFAIRKEHIVKKLK